jgi:hypothetical protein
MPTRTKILCIGDVDLPLPVFFPSVSSVKTALPPATYLELLCSLSVLNKQFLVSAFDLEVTDGSSYIRQLLEKAQNAGVVILMDSGNYESYWKDAQKVWGQPDYHNALERYPFSLAFGFDEQRPPQDFDAHIQLVVDRWRHDQTAARSRTIVPIVHAGPNELSTLCARIAEITGTPMIAVPERRLGDGILERAAAVRAIRAALDRLDSYIALHLLGTGNPISIAIYSSQGADSFDGLEWCQTVVDHETSLLFHLSQADFFRAQTIWGEDGLSFHARTLAHNLEFYGDWMRRLRDAIHEGDVIRFCRFNFPSRVFQKCSAALGWK